MSVETLPFLMVGITFVILLLGYPVAFSLAGSAIIFGLYGLTTGNFDTSFFSAFPERIFGIIGNQTLIAVPLFIFMGVVLERSKIAEGLLETMGKLFGRLRGGLAISVCLVGGILAASTGIVGATVVTMGLISLPVMIKHRYDPAFASGVITASGTLGQIIPPSIILVILGDVISSAYQQAQLSLGNYSPRAVSVGDLFLGALFPGILLVCIYIVYILIISWIKPNIAPSLGSDTSSEQKGTSTIEIFKVLLPPFILITLVLGSILAGIATPTEAAAVGSVGVILLAYQQKGLNRKVLHNSCKNVARINSMVFTILIGSSMFSLVFRGYGGDEVIASYLSNLPGGVISAFLLVMGIMFFLGFFLDFFEITFVVVPIVGPVLLTMGLDPVWLGVMIAVNLQTSFLTPPFGFALFYLRGVAPPSISTLQIYRGVIPFITIQIAVLVILWFYPGLVTWLPEQVYQ